MEKRGFDVGRRGDHFPPDADDVRLDEVNALLEGMATTEAISGAPGLGEKKCVF